MWVNGRINFIGYKNYTKTQEILGRSSTVLQVAVPLSKLYCTDIHSCNKQY